MKGANGTTSRSLAEDSCTQILLDFLYEILLYQKVIFDTECPDESILVVSDYEDKNGKDIAEFMIDWDELETILDKGYNPIAIGAMPREEVQQRLDLFDPIAADNLRSTNGLVIVVVGAKIAIIHDLLF